MKLDILAFGAHPDDVELSCAGMLLAEKAHGKNTGIIDLTEGELGSRGSVETRYLESAKAAQILGLTVRENLQLKDGFFQSDIDTQMKVVRVIRKYRPEIVFCNAPEDRHPDHGRAAQLVADACFLSGLLKIVTTDEHGEQAHWRPKYVMHYIQDRFIEPDFLYDISPFFEAKMEAIKSYSTQFFNPSQEGPETYISKPEFLESINGRNKLLGKRIGVAYAEGFITKKIIGIQNLDAVIQHNT